MRRPSADDRLLSMGVFGGVMLAIGGWMMVAAAAAGQTAVPPAADAAPEAATVERTSWDGVYTEAQARRGRRVFRDECASCHKVDEFAEAYPTAYDLFAFRTTMPESAPGALSDEAYADMIAYVFQAAKMPAGDTELPADDDALKLIRITRAPSEP